MQIKFNMEEKNIYKGVFQFRSSDRFCLRFSISPLIFFIQQTK